MRKLLLGLALTVAGITTAKAAVTPVQGSSFTYVIISTALQANTTGPAGVNVTSGTIKDMHVSTVTFKDGSQMTTASVGSGGSQIYPTTAATTAPTFTYGLASSTGVFSSTVSATAGIFSSTVTSPGANISTVAAITQLKFADGTTQTTAPTAGATKFSHVISPLDIRTSSDSCVIANSTASMTPSLLCDDSSEEFVLWSWALYPYTATSLTFQLNYSMLSATTGNVTFYGEIQCTSPGDAADIDTASYAAYVSSTVAVPGTAGYLSKAVINLTDDTCAAGDQIIMRFGREGAAAADTAAGDAEIRPSFVYEP